jgi:hypothetical protein
MKGLVEAASAFFTAYHTKIDTYMERGRPAGARSEWLGMRKT